MTQGGEDILFPGKVVSDGRISNPIIRTDSEAQHLACFAGGMVAIGSKIFNNVDDMDVARKLVEGCLWAYEVSPLGIMPEVMHTVRCKNRKNCEWNPEKWHEGVRRVHLGNKKSPEEIIEERHIPPGVIKVTDRRYILRYVG
jgi:mannosyl-oligosaccharide alpha-1,2-mannosidase